jgi:hypothetical protein
MDEGDSIEIKLANGEKLLLDKVAEINVKRRSRVSQLAGLTSAASL